ncbi:MAG: hypothetical protein A3K67_00640 [Euryarchaeota archaeon RBG_16_62_10]|nr:MAG: hypothetical protein A3K67_00640 [Euryarchaeota archaeon RBG_16_62_10]
MSIQLAGAFAVVGVGLLYLYIAVSEVSDQTKILQAGGLSIVVAFVFLIVWALARDYVPQPETRSERKSRT